MAKVINADTKTIRAFFNENPNLVPEGDKTVGSKSAGRGRLSKDAREVFTKHNPDAKFVEGDAAKQVTKSISLDYTHVQPSGKKVKKTVTLLPAEVRALVPEAPERGKLSAANLALAGERYAENVKAARETKVSKPKAEAAETE